MRKKEQSTEQEIKREKVREERKRKIKEERERKRRSNRKGENELQGFTENYKGIFQV